MNSIVSGMDIVDFLKWRGESFSIKNEADLLAAHEIEHLRDQFGSLTQRMIEADRRIKALERDLSASAQGNQSLQSIIGRILVHIEEIREQVNLVYEEQSQARNLSPITITLDSDDESDEGGIWDSRKDNPDS